MVAAKCCSAAIGRRSIRSVRWSRLPSSISAPRRRRYCSARTRCASSVYRARSSGGENLDPERLGRKVIGGRVVRWASGDRREHVHLGQEVDVIPLLGGGRAQLERSIAAQL